MLVLTRQVGQTIMLGQDIAITITNISMAPGAAHEVRIGISAPRDLRILRSELYSPPRGVTPDTAADVGDAGDAGTR